MSAGSPTPPDNEKRLAYIVGHEAWYHSAALRRSEPYVMVGVYYDGGGCDWELEITWVNLQGKECPRLKLFSDAWVAFVQQPALFLALAELNDSDPSVAEMTALLDRLGAVDQTERKRAAR